MFCNIGKRVLRSSLWCRWSSGPAPGTARLALRTAGRNKRSDTSPMKIDDLTGGDTRHLLCERERASHSERGWHMEGLFQTSRHTCSETDDLLQISTPFPLLDAGTGFRKAFTISGRSAERGICLRATDSDNTATRYPRGMARVASAKKSYTKCCGTPISMTCTFATVKATVTFAHGACFWHGEVETVFSG